jgi:arabinosaccharide transport system substrate-binding protein
MDYPFGKAALWILLVALLSGVGVLSSQRAREATRPDLVFLTFSKDHAEAYYPVIRAFERQHNVTVRLEKVGLVALQERLRAALAVNAEVPDLVELGVQLMGAVTRGPLDDVGFWDLTDKIRETGLDQRLVASRFSGYSSRGRIFALPHDVHPVMLAYRRDLVEQLGIDVSTLTTWDEFARVGRRVTKDLDGDGVIDRFMVSFPDDLHDGPQILLMQRDVSLFDADGNVAFDNETAVDTVCWYVKQTEGPTRISFSTKYGQDIARSIMNGLCLFYICPDWQSRQFQNDIPLVSGKMALMPLPAWTPGGKRTSTWGATGLAITSACKNKDLAWQLAMALYYDRAQLGPRFRDSNILPALKDAWSLPEYAEPRPYFSNQPIGQLYAALAPTVPADYPTPYTQRAQFKLRDAYLNTKLYYRQNGDAGLRDFCRTQIHAAANDIRLLQSRNAFTKAGAP